MRNPFSGHGTPVQGERLVGRDIAVGRLVGCLSASGGGYSVVGMPHIGKSSLIKEVAHRLQAQPTPPVFVECDLSIYPDPHGMFRALRSEIIDAIEQSGRSVPDRIYELYGRLAESLSDEFRILRLILHGLVVANPALHVVVFFDEFDAITRLPDGAHVVRLLRALLSADNLGLSLIFASRLPLAALEERLAELSTLSESCQTQHLGPLDEAGLRAMLARCAPDWSPTEDEASRVWWFTGGHPYLAELLLYFAWEHRSAELGAREAIGSIFTYYSANLQGALEGMRAFDLLIELTVGPRHRLQPEWIARLLQYGLVRKLDAPPIHRFRAWSEHFQIYLEKRSREGIAWEAFSSAERALREVIESAVPVETLEREPSLAPLMALWRSRRDQEHESFGFVADGRLIEYAYPDELAQILFCFWPIFEPRFGAREPWIDAFALLGRVRNPTLTGQPITIHRSEFAAAEAHCQSLLKCCGA